MPTNEKLKMIKGRCLRMTDAIRNQQNTRNPWWKETPSPPDYYEFLSLFEKAPTSKLTHPWLYIHQIPLKEGLMPPYGPIYVFSDPNVNNCPNRYGKVSPKVSSIHHHHPVEHWFCFSKKKKGQRSTTLFQLLTTKRRYDWKPEPFGHDLRYNKVVMKS